MKVCVLGNSHIACVKHAWDKVKPDFPGIELTFFGSNANTLESVYAEGSCLLPGSTHVESSWELTSGGSRVLDFSEYDWVVVHGVLPYVMRWNRLQGWIRKNPGVSTNFVKDCFWSGHPLTEHVLTEVNKLEKNKVLLTPRPSPVSKDEDVPIAPERYEALSEFIVDGFKEFGYRVEIQPRSTLTQRFHTLREFNAEGIGMGERPDGLAYAGDKDRNHMNIKFGGLYLETILPDLKV